MYLLAIHAVGLGRFICVRVLGVLVHPCQATLLRPPSWVLCTRTCGHPDSHALLGLSPRASRSLAQQQPTIAAAAATAGSLGYRA